MIIAGVDPSITCTGVGILDLPDDRLIDAVKIRPPSKVDRQPLTSMQRIDHICLELISVLEPTRPDVVVLEVTSGKMSKRGRAGAGAGLATYGMCVGAVWRDLLMASELLDLNWRVIPVYENDWTKGYPKSARQETVKIAYPTYDASKDNGMDVSDAIGLARWWWLTKGVFEDE